MQLLSRILFTSFWDLAILLVHCFTTLVALGLSHLMARFHHLLGSHRHLLRLIRLRHLHRHLHLIRFLHLCRPLVGFVVIHFMLLVSHSDNIFIGAVAAATTDTQFALDKLLTNGGTRLAAGGIMTNLAQRLAECRFFEWFIAHTREKGCRAVFKILSKARFKCRLLVQAFWRNTNTVVIVIASSIGRLDHHDWRWRRDGTRLGRWKEFLATGITSVLFVETSLIGTRQFPACGATHGNTTEIIILGTESRGVLGNVVELALRARQTASTLGLIAAHNQVVVLVGTPGQRIDSNDAWLLDHNNREQCAVTRS